MDGIIPILHIRDLSDFLTLRLRQNLQRAEHDLNTGPSDFKCDVRRLLTIGTCTGWAASRTLLNSVCIYTSNLHNNPMWKALSFVPIFQRKKQVQEVMNLAQAT